MLTGCCVLPDSGGSSGPGYELCLQPHYAWIQNMFRAVPFARGFIKKEKLRELDVEIRKYVAGRLDEAYREVEAARQALASAVGQALFASTPMLSPVPAPSPGELGVALQALPVLSERLRSIGAEVSGLASDLLYADSGWAPVGAARAIREDEILRLCEYDDSMIGLGEAAARTARELRAAVGRGDYQKALELLGRLEEVARSLRELYEERRRFLQFASSSDTVAGRLRAAAEAAVEGLGSAVSRARGLLARLSRRGG